MLKFVQNVIHSIQVSRKLQLHVDVLISSIKNTVLRTNSIRLILSVKDKVEVLKSQPIFRLELCEYIGGNL